METRLGGGGGGSIPKGPWRRSTGATGRKALRVSRDFTFDVRRATRRITLCRQITPPPRRGSAAPPPPPPPTAGGRTWCRPGARRDDHPGPARRTTPACTQTSRSYNDRLCSSSSVVLEVRCLGRRWWRGPPYARSKNQTRPRTGCAAPPGRPDTIPKRRVRRVHIPHAHAPHVIIMKSAPPFNSTPFQNRLSSPPISRRCTVEHVHVCHGTVTILASRKHAKTNELTN